MNKGRTLLKKYLDDNRLTPEQFAVKIGVSSSSVWRWLRDSGPGSRAVRQAIEHHTDGKVPESSWTNKKKS